MKRILLSMLVFLVLAASASAQVKVTGRVIDLQNKPVSDVIVKMVSGTKTLAFTSSNAKGEYALELKSAPTGEVTLQFFASKATRGRAPLRSTACLWSVVGTFFGVYNVTVTMRNVRETAFATFAVPLQPDSFT